MAEDGKKLLTLDAINPHVRRMQYAVKGPITDRAAAIEKELAKGVPKPFKEVIMATVGDAQSLGQAPITFIRQIFALVAYPPLLEDPCFPEDAKLRARDILKECGGNSIGGTIKSAGIEIVRKHIAEYIKRRDDGIPADYQNIVLCIGSSEAIKIMMSLVKCDKNGKRPGIVVPVPLYPIYSANITEYDMQEIDYCLDEEKNWSLDAKDLQRAIDEARKTCNPKVLVVINPGNPTGQVLTRENIVDIIKFAYKEKLVIFADEVFQLDIYGEGCKFYSFKRVIVEMGAPYSQMELVSFMSGSKGYMGESSIGGGWVEFFNISSDIVSLYVKPKSINMNSSTFGQVLMDCVANPPKPGEESYDSFTKEKTNIETSLANASKLVYEAFNTIPGYSCNPIQAAINAFPRFEIPPKAVKAAKRVGQTPDTFYVQQLLEKKGICVIPGSGFGQRGGTYHYRMTIFTDYEKMKRILQAINDFHKEFLREYK